MKRKTIIILMLLVFCLAELYVILSKVLPRPNVVLIIIDTLRDDKLGCYGYPADISPEIDEIAGKGVLFKNVIAQNSWTRPSIGSMLTSLYPRSLGIYKERFDILQDKYLTLPEILKSNGYTTFGITANPNINKFFNFDQGFDRYMDSHVIWRWMTPEKGKVEFSEIGVVFRSDFPDDDLVLKLKYEGIIKRKPHNFQESVIFDKNIKNELQLQSRLRKAGVKEIETVSAIWRKSQQENFPTTSKAVFQKTIDFAQSKISDGPFYVQINIMEVHNPWLLVRPEYKKNFLKLEDKDGPWYHDAVKQVSYDINQFIGRLQKIPDWDNTLFIITSDHGEGLGDHPAVAYSRLHGKLLYKSQLKVPLIFYHPHPGESEVIGWVRKRLSYHYLKNKTVQRPVRLIDLMPTILDYLHIPLPADIEGKSLLELVNKEGAGPELPPYFVVETNYRDTNKIAAYSEQWEYIENRDSHKGVNRYELQPIGIRENGKATDKIEQESQISLQMKEYIRSWEMRYPKAEAVSPGREPSNEEINQLKSLGYLN